MGYTVQLYERSLKALIVDEKHVLKFKNTQAKKAYFYGFSYCNVHVR